MEQIPDKTVIASLHYFPATAWMKAYLTNPHFLIEKYENYQKRSGRNRCRIAGANGALMLSIPLQQGKTQQAYRDVKIACDMPWQTQHWRSIASAYGKSPFFEHYAPELEPLFLKPVNFLFDWNLQCLEALLECLQLDVTFKFTESYQMEYPQATDLRNRLMKEPFYEFPVSAYPQVFSHKLPFDDHLSMLDLLFCMGPDYHHYL